MILFPAFDAFILLAAFLFQLTPRFSARTPVCVFPRSFQALHNFFPPFIHLTVEPLAFIFALPLRSYAES